MSDKTNSTTVRLRIAHFPRTALLADAFVLISGLAAVSAFALLGSPVLKTARSTSTSSAPLLPVPVSSTGNLTPASAIAQRSSDGESPQAALVTIRATGFEPAEITLSAGRFLLAVDNRSGLPEIALQLDREAGGGKHLHSVRVPREKPDWRQSIDLPPGRYVLTEATHPDWICHITIATR